MDALPLALLVFSANLLVIIGVATVAEAAGRVNDPGFRLIYWRGVALACIAIPLSALVVPEGVSAGVAFPAVLLPGTESVPFPTVPPAASGAVWWLVCAGALARVCWLCAGAVRLRQLRRRSRATVLTEDLETIRSEVAPQAQVRVSCEIAQPASFGLRQPVVLLPEDLFAMDPEAQRAVVYHELLHVARRDWSWIVVEEVARALFWFHPAVWWLVDRIQESREQVIDRLVIARIPSKRAYMAALLAFADARRPTILATAFLRRHQLRSRLRTLVKESIMSRRRLVWTALVLMCVMAGAVAGTVMALPIDWPGRSAAVSPQQAPDGKDPALTWPKVISEVRPQYTPEALEARIEGTVMMTAVIRTDGRPADIEVTKSLDTEHGLDKQAVAALSLWRFEPARRDGEPVPVRVTIEMRFSLK